jgi:hypothetical protein
MERSHETTSDQLQELTMEQTDLVTGGLGFLGTVVAGLLIAAGTAAINKVADQYEFDPDAAEGALDSLTKPIPLPL